jgi:hypothetical protein
MDFGPLWQVGTALVLAGAVYGAIRMDLKGIHRTLADHKERAEKIEDRFNAHIEKGLTHGNS